MFLDIGSDTEEAPKLFRRREAAKYLNLSVFQFDRLVQAGRIPCKRRGTGQRYFTREDLNNWLLYGDRDKAAPLPVEPVKRPRRKKTTATRVALPTDDWEAGRPD